jgi:hypothetical protein
MSAEKTNHGNNKIKYFFFMVLLGILVIPASASVATDENVWVVRTAATIGIHEKIEFQGYTIKVHDFYDDRVSLAVYKNGKFIELFDYYQDDSRQYEDMSVEVYTIGKSSTLVAISTLELKSVWAERDPAHAFWKDYILRDEYGIEVLSFNNDSVNLVIYNNGNRLIEDTYYKDTEREYRNDFKIYVSNIDNDGYVDIRFFKKLSLSITGNIETDKDVYRPDEHINCQIEISNSGNSPINLVDVALKAKSELNISKPGYPLNNLVPNQSHVFELILTPSAKHENSNILLNAEVTLIDYFGEKYYYNFSKNIYISSSVGIIKEVIPSELDFQADSQKAHNMALVKLTVFNVGTSSKNLTILDTIKDGISLYNSSSLQWNRDIQPGGNSTITYYIIPDVPGEYALPPAKISYNNELSYSSSALFTVHGPVINISKTATIVNNTIFVTNSIQNKGNKPAYVVVIDNLPQGSSIIDGNDFWENVLHPGDVEKFNYSIPYTKGLDSLPGARVEYQDIKGNKWNFESNPVELGSVTIGSEIKTDLAIFLLFAYFVILGLVVCILIIIGAVIYIQGGKHD